MAKIFFLGRNEHFIEYQPYQSAHGIDLPELHTYDGKNSITPSYHLAFSYQPLYSVEGSPHILCVACSHVVSKFMNMNKNQLMIYIEINFTCLASSKHTGQERLTLGDPGSSELITQKAHIF